MRSLKLLACSIVAGFLISSCDDDSNQATIEDLSPFARNFLSQRSGSMSANNFSSARGFADITNQSFQRLSSKTNLLFGRLKGDSTDTGGGSDTTYYPSPWVTCAIITTTVNPDRSTTVEYDYGDGCEEGSDYYKYFMYGKYSYTNFYENEKTGSTYKDVYHGNYNSDNFGGHYTWDGRTYEWTSDGTSSYSGWSSYDTAAQTWRGQYEYNGDNTSTYDGVTYTYKGQGKSSYDEKGSITEKNDYSYTTDEYSYSTKVLIPLVTNYECSYVNGIGNDKDIAYCMWIPVYVSGREEIHYKDGEKEGSFIIDYGDGECDSIITIIENGTRVKVDLYDRTLYY
jgi:hypothetical protein